MVTAIAIAIVMIVIAIRRQTMMAIRTSMLVITRSRGLVVRDTKIFEGTITTMMIVYA